MPVGVYPHKPRQKWVKEKISRTMKGKRPKNFELLKTKSPFIKNHKQLNTGKTHFKKGMTPWNKGIEWPEMQKENHPNWKGGTYNKNRKIDMQRKNYRDWRKLVIERDKYTCVWCGGNKDLHVDHIKPYSLYPDLRYDLSNGRTLCAECHKGTETYGKKIEQLEVQFAAL